MRYTIVLIITLLMANNDCDSPDPIISGETQTEILDVIVIPEILAVGDTATFRCIIKDSLDSSFKFIWGIHEDDIVAVDGLFNSNVIRWSSTRYVGSTEDSIQVISLSVIADNGNRDLLTASYNFEFELKHK